jgi:hypothetical protein
VAILRWGVSLRRENLYYIEIYLSGGSEMECKSGNHIFAVCLLILFCFSGSGFCAVFDNGVGDYYWCDPGNWDIGILPGPTESVEIGPMGNCIIIDCDVDISSLNFLCDPYMCLTILSGIVNIGGIERNECEGDLYFNFLGGTTTINGEIRVADEGWTHWVISGSTLLINGNVRAGDNGGTGWNVNMDSGVAVFGDQVEIGDDGGGIWNLSGTASLSFLDDFQPHLSDGVAVFELNVSGDAEMVVVKTLSTNDKDGGDGTANINIDGGTLYVGENLELGDNGSGNLNVTAGLLVVGGTLELNRGEASLTGGEVRADDIEIENGVMDIGASEALGGPVGSSGGTLILNCNFSKIWDLVNSGKLTGCGSARGIVVDYGGTNPGKTTVTSTCAINFCQAWGPDPADGATKVQSLITEVCLDWIEGDCLGPHGHHKIYFSDDCNDLHEVNPIFPLIAEWVPPFELDFCVGNLELWKTYCWRVDSYNQDGTVTQGAVWSFTTGCELIAGDVNMDCLVNFLDFAELASTFGQEEFWPE